MCCNLTDLLRRARLWCVFCLNLSMFKSIESLFSYYSLVLWLAGGSSWSRPHRKVRRRVSSFWSSGFGMGWVRSRLGVSLGKMRGGWSRKLSKISTLGKNKQSFKHKACTSWLNICWAELATYRLRVQCLGVEPNMKAELWMVLAYNEWEGGEAVQGLITNAPPVSWPKMTDNTFSDVRKEKIFRFGIDHIPKSLFFLKAINMLCL